LTATTTRK